MYINNISEFHKYVGDTIEYCQCIENDIRWIYSAMLKVIIAKHLMNWKGASQL